MKHKYVWVGAIVSVILFLDQLSKKFIQTHIRLHDIYTVIPGFFNITHVRNRGAAFGILSNLPDIWRTGFFVVLTIAAVIAIMVMIIKANERLLVIAFSLIMSGAIGNVIDRIRYGEVVDFIQWYVKSYYWPSFNVADSAISIGVTLLVIDMLFLQKKRNGKEERASTNDQAPNPK